MSNTCEMFYGTDELRVIRSELRATWNKLKAMRLTSCEARCFLNEIDSVCVEITDEIEAFEPHLPLPVPMHVGGGR